MYKRILLAYDGSMEGRTALREGALMARRCASQVFLLSVIAEDAGTRLADSVGGGETQQSQRSETLLKDGLARLRRLGFDAQARLAIGEPAGVIGACAKEFDADLVVVGYHRHGVFWRWWAGSSGGAYVSDHVHCSVLVCRNLLSDEAFAAEWAKGDGADAAQTSKDDALAGPAPAAEPAEPLGAKPADAPADELANAPADEPPAGRSRTRLVLFMLLPLALIAGAYFYVTGGQVVSLENAYVVADKLGISTDVSGIVASVEVRDNQRVVSGQVLFRLDELPFRLALESAQAQIGVVRDALKALQANHRDTQAQIDQGQEDVSYFSTEFNRQKDLLAAHFVSQAGLDTARRNLQTAQGKLASLLQQRAAIAAQLNGQPEASVERNPRYLQAVAQQAEAARQLARCIVRAPFAGVVTSVPSITPGKVLPASTTAFYLVATDHVWVEANPKETELTHVQAGQAATVMVDAYPNAQWRGTVQSISPAAAQAFSLLPAQNTSGNWVKVVQRIPLRVRLDTGAKDLPTLRDGMSVEVHIDTGHARGWPHFLSGWIGHGAS